MGRYSHYDTDEERLPENMTRIGYDADTQVYTYRDETDGSIWEGAPGSRYGQMHRVSGGPPASHDHGGDGTNNPPPYSDTHHTGTTYADYVDGGSSQPHRSWRQENMPLLNFFLIIGLFLLAVFYFMGVSFSGGGTTKPMCGEGQAEYEVRRGDTCWAIAETRGMSVQELTGLNPGVDCDKLGVGSVLCLSGKAPAV